MHTTSVHGMFKLYCINSGRETMGNVLISEADCAVHINTDKYSEHIMFSVF